MFALSKLFLFVSLIHFAVTAPAGEIEKRETLDKISHCGQWDSVTAGHYSLLLDQWGLSEASSGSGCASLTSLSGTTIAWKNTWTWNGDPSTDVCEAPYSCVGGPKIKSFTNMQLNSGLNTQLSAISSIPATWKWSQSSTGTVVADVAYDLFTSTTRGGSNAIEIMIWLANFNASPISATYNSNGQPKPVASKVSLAGHTWKLYKGSNGFNTVFSFLPSNGASITSFSGNLNVFLKYLTAHQGVSTSQYLKTAQGGTEATSGSATFTTSAFSLAIN